MAASITKSCVLKPLLNHLLRASSSNFALTRHLTVLVRNNGTREYDHNLHNVLWKRAIHHRHVGTLSESQKFRRGGNEFTDSEEELDYDIDESKLDTLMKQHRTQAQAQHISEGGVQFSDFPISEQLLSRLTDLGYKEPFDVQSKTLPLTLNGKDVIGRAQTGSGKTLAFSIPVVEKLMSSKPTCGKDCPRAIVISPTRELCLQIYRSVQELNSRVRCLPVYGGESFFKQQSSIFKRGVDVVCATPGRLRDHLERGTLKLDALEFLCLDEADHLLTPEFLIQIENVLKNSPRDKQVMLFSATLPPDIQRITREYMKDAQYVDLVKDQSQRSPTSVKHLCMNIPHNFHMDAICELIKNTYKPERCIVFIKTKHMTKQVAHVLQRHGLDAQELHSDLSQSKRQNVLSAFRTGQIEILVATDVAARGLDIPEVDLVIQVEPPQNGIDFYIHRSGRTGRAGREGMAIMIHSGSRDDREIISKIERMVDLEHTNGPDLRQLKMNKLDSLAGRITHMKDRELDVGKPLAEKLLSQPDADSHRILAAALSLLVKGEKEKTEFRPSDSNSFGRRPQFNRKPQFSQNRTDRFSSFRNSRNYDDNDDERFYNRQNRNQSFRRRRNFDDEEEEW